MTLRPVDSAAAHVVLHRSARSRGYKLSREWEYLKSLWWRACFWVMDQWGVTQSKSVLFGVPPRSGPYLSFYSSQGEGSGYSRGKKVKQGKEREKQKTKRVAAGVAVFLLIRHEQFTL
jgi:hypothetical protein